MCACRFDREAVASPLLERSIALDPELGKHIDGSTGRVSFIKAFEKSDFAQVAELGLWKVFVMEQVSRAVVDGDLTAFVGWLQRETWLLGEASVDFQDGMIGAASLNDRGEIIAALLDLDPAILRRQPLAPSKAIEWAFMYANTHLLSLLTRIWPVPDDLPHAAGMGNLARVKQWFDSAGVLRNLDDHYPYNDPDAAQPPRVGYAHGAAGARRGARLRRDQPSLRCGGLPPRARRTSTPTGTPMSRPASCTTWSFCRTATTRCDS